MTSRQLCSHYGCPSYASSSRGSRSIRVTRCQRPLATPARQTSAACHMPTQPSHWGRASFLRATLGSVFMLQCILSAPAGAVELPANYVKFARRLISALKESIEADLSPASEVEVRRRADPAKGMVKEWVQNWRDVRVVSGDASFKQIKESLQLLGDFYLKKGQRTRLPPELGSEILRRLDEASAALPSA